MKNLILNVGLLFLGAIGLIAAFVSALLLYFSGYEMERVLLLSGGVVLTALSILFHPRGGLRRLVEWSLELCTYGGFLAFFIAGILHFADVSPHWKWISLSGLLAGMISLLVRLGVWQTLQWGLYLAVASGIVAVIYSVILMINDFYVWFIFSGTAGLFVAVVAFLLERRIRPRIKSGAPLLDKWFGRNEKEGP